VQMRSLVAITLSLAVACCAAAPLATEDGHAGSSEDPSGAIAHGRSAQALRKVGTFAALAALLKKLRAGKPPTVEVMHNWVNYFWYAWEFGLVDEWKALGSDASEWHVNNFNLTLPGVDTIWGEFREPQGMPELYWQCVVQDQYFDAPSRTLSYVFLFILKYEFNGLPAGTICTTGRAIITFDDDWLWLTNALTIYFDIASEEPLLGYFPTPASPYVEAAVSAPTLTDASTESDVVNWLNAFWYAWEFGLETEWKGLGTEDSAWSVANFGITFLGDETWDDFRAPQGLPELFWQCIVEDHYVDVAARSVSYAFRFMLKTEFNDLPAGTVLTTGRATMTFEPNVHGTWKWATNFVTVYYDIAGDPILGYFPTPTSPYTNVTAPPPL